MKVSVAVCTYNGAPFIKAQLLSILTQTTGVDEIIVSDDNSSDKTLAVVKTLTSKFPNIIIKANKINVGPIRNFEKAIAACTGDVIFLADQDDTWHHNKVEEVLHFFEKNHRALAVFTDGNIIDEAGNATGETLWTKWNFNSREQERWRNNHNAIADLEQNINKVTGATLAFKSELKTSLFPFDISKPHQWHDGWISLNAAERNGLYFIDKPLIDYRVHSKQLVGVGNGTTLRTAGIKKRKHFIKRMLSYSSKLFK